MLNYLKHSLVFFLQIKEKCKIFNFHAIFNIYHYLIKSGKIVSHAKRNIVYFIPFPPI